MTNRKPLVLVEGVATGLPVGDTLSTELMLDSLNKRFVTDVEKAAIGASGGVPLIAIQDTQPDYKCLWIQTNIDGDSNKSMIWLILEDI